VKNPHTPNHSSPLDTSVSAWLRIQQSLAEQLSIALLTLTGNNEVLGRIANGNSICEAMQSSDHKILCDQDCGAAPRKALEANQRIEYRCHAFLHCFAAPVSRSGAELVVLGGRAFAAPADFRKCLERYAEFEPIQSATALNNVHFISQNEMDEIATLVTSTAETHLRRQNDAILQSEAPIELEPTSALFDAHLEILRLTEELERRNRAITQLQDFMRDVAATLNSETIYTNLLTKFSEIMQTEKSSLLVLHEESAELSLEAAVGAAFTSSEKIRVKIGDGISGAVLATGMPLLVHNIDTDKRIRPQHPEQYKTKSFISYPIILGERKFGVINLTDRVDGAAYEKQDLYLMDMLAPQLALIIDRTEWYKKAEQYQQMSLTDALTGLPNRRYLEERLFEEVERSKRYSTPLAFMLIDIDYFKKFNDIFGHTNADRVLIKTAQILRRAVRAIDMPARYAGDEFCIILPETDLHSAAYIAERLCNEVRRTNYQTQHGESMGSVTLSVGVSAFGVSRQTPNAIIETADRALYQAKMRGRNGVAIYKEEE
jgi:diguanylate cyclase (GGDEF)-like protein